MITTPYQVHTLAEDVQTHPRVTKKIARWMLYIDGPFCLWPRPRNTTHHHGNVARLVNACSALLALNVRASYSRSVVEVHVNVDEVTRLWLVRKEYERVVGRS